MAERIRCRICGGALELQADGRAQCLKCGLFYSAEALAALWPTGSASGEPQEETPAADGAEDSTEDELAALQREQRRLLTEMRLADGVYGPAQRRQLNSQLRKVEKRLAQLEGRRLPFWF